MGLEYEIESNLNNVASSLAVEGLKQSNNAKEITTRFLRGEITSEQAITAIKLIYI
jgi:hypothetical protein